MNILIVSATDSSYNSLRPDSEIYVGLIQSGHKVTVITHGDSEYAQRFRDCGIEVIDGHPSKKISFKCIKLIRNLLKTRHYDIVFATNSKAIPNAAFGCIGSSVKFITYRGTTGGLYRHDPSAYLTHLHPRVDGVICVADAVREDVVKRVWKNKQNIVTIYKGHELSWYNKSPVDLGEFGISKDDFTVICAVNARPSKGIAIMIEAANYLADIENIHILLVGRNMDKEPYDSLIKSNKMRGRIHLTGYRHDTPELILASDVLVQPSISGEGLPRAMMEAMGYGTPAVVTTTGGGKEVVEDGVTGFVVPVKDPLAIADRVRKLYSQPELVASMAKRGKEKIENEFTSRKTVENFIKYFESVIKS